MTSVFRIALAAGACALSGCVATPMGYMHGAAGPASRPIEALAQGFVWICMGVVVVILAMILLAIRRGRRATREDGATVHRASRGLGGIYWGLGVSLPVLLAMAMWNFVVTRAVASPPSAKGLLVQITAHQWWWEIRYQADRPGDVFTTANELMVPTGTPVHLQITSADVIHDFWVPKLGPKMDVIPGLWNATWMQADVAGTYVGQCAEFCGLEHAKMGIRVVALPPGEFATWLQHARQPAQPSQGRGAEVFAEDCSSCHTVRGTTAGGIYGPDLTHFASRTTLASGILPNTPAAREQWLAHTQALKPGALMPQIPMDDDERKAVVDYLGSLH
jgi:cytochrome c oxidase subunit 2